MVASGNNFSAVRRFTLIELLAVIGIIALLVGLLLPAIAKSRQKAKATDCTNRMKQMGIAIHMYAQDYEDWLPPISFGDMIFIDNFQPYLGSTTEIWLCPAGNMEPRQMDTPSGRLLHYGINNYDYDISNQTLDEHLPGLSRQRIRFVADPENVIYVADADPESSPHNIGGAQSGTTDWPLTSLCEDRHMRGYNALYLGGAFAWHVNAANHTKWAVKRK